MAKIITVPIGVTSMIQQLLVDWIDKRNSINERYISLIKVADVTKKYAEDKYVSEGSHKKKQTDDLNAEWKILEEMKRVNEEILADEESIRNATFFGEYGYFPDGIYGGVNPTEYIFVLRKRVKENKKTREILTTGLTRLIYKTFAGAEVFEEKLKRAFDKAFAYISEREKIFK